MPFSRRRFVSTAACTAIGAMAFSRRGVAAAGSSPFHVAVINDEISPDFDHACSVIANEFGLHWIELRSMWGKNVMDLDAAQIADAKKILAKYELKVTDIASPLFKTDWPSAPRSKFSTAGDRHGATDATFKEQDHILEHSIELAKEFGTGKVRCFDFWRIDDVSPYRAAIDDKLRAASDTAGKHGILLVLENEFECNTGTGRESVRTLNAVKSPHFSLNWDPGNAVMAGELDAFPTAWELLPKDRIHHCHVKNAVKNAAGKIEWAPVGTGYIDWTAQFRALHKAGFHEAVSLETHWHGGGTPEESSRKSWADMKVALTSSGTL